MQIYTLYIKSTKNNIFFTIIKGTLFTKLSNFVVSTNSYGQLKKLTPFLLNVLINKSLKKIIVSEQCHLHIVFKGIGQFKKIILSIILCYNIKILSITEITSIAHNGCRQKKIKKR